ncbi:PadR family transcriptional regulator [Glutamicibacter ectropisis]|uniref:PadR family transcriptional regulator n=1 Tax=Glutamicibacter ectropisis TaxID=3046593 RepID=A0AAU6W991_9MICC
MASKSRFPASWQRAMLPLLLLDQLDAGPAHGYAIAKALTDRGFDPLKGATLYPALAKLEASGVVSTTWEEGQGGPGRKVYELTDVGRTELAEQKLLFSGFAQLVTNSER